MNRPAIAQFTRATAIRSAFPHPVEGWFGNSSCNIVRGPGTANIDFSPFKDFKTERFDVQFRTEFFGVLNHPQFGFPDTKRERLNLRCNQCHQPKGGRRNQETRRASPLTSGVAGRSTRMDSRCKGRGQRNRGSWGIRGRRCTSAMFGSPQFGDGR
jgi:hypothetical protein